MAHLKNNTGIQLNMVLKNLLRPNGPSRAPGLRYWFVRVMARVVDMGISDPFNMGGAMAPAAVDY